LDEFVTFLVILLAGIFFSEVFKRLHLPYVLSLIIAGIVVGPLGLNIITFTPTILFLSSIGVIFLMFNAGLEVKIKYLTKIWKKIGLCALINGGIPSLAGFLICYIFGYDITSCVLMGTIFVSSSIAVIIPSLQEKALLKTDFGSVIVGSVVLEDIASLFLLSIILQTTDPTTSIPLPLFVIIVLGSILLLRLFLPRIETAFFNRSQRKGAEEQVQLIFISLIAIAIYFEFLGVHAIVAGFLTGLILSELIKGKPIEDKLHVLSYGVFIPIFFLGVGVETDLTVFSEVSGSAALSLTIVLGLFTSKILSGYLCGKLMKFKEKNRLLFGVASTPQLSTSLAVAFTALELGLIDSSLQVSIVLLSVITVLLSPLLIELITKPPKPDLDSRDEN
jgi:Kef-type K+ transport system membrane component KefB